MYYYIVNPAAGHSQLRGLQEKIRARLDELGIRGEWAKTTGPGEAGKMAAAAAASGHTTIVAVGGDDTVNEVINGLASNEQIAIGILPLGKNNRIATQLGIRGWQQACEVLAARRITPYSLIAAGQKFFLSNLALGFETELDKSVDTTRSGWQARLAQLWAGWSQAKDYTSLRARLTVDEQYTIECDLFSCQIANQKFLNPTLDNRLVVSLAGHPGRRLQLGAYLWQLIRHHNDAATEDVATTRFTAERVVLETDPSTSIMVDGKVTGRTPVAIRLTGQHVRFITEKVMGEFQQAVKIRY
ncbi:MAG TPA: diacylglycerol kinase family protein [Candidatus Saccharimonas sp.]|nr:diacylglycerol kinase family protein [Candidatus Saccharimonas sp.]